MSESWSIIKRAFLMPFQNFSSVLKLWLPVVLIVTLLFWVLGSMHVPSGLLWLRILLGVIAMVYMIMLISATIVRYHQMFLIKDHPLDTNPFRAKYEQGLGYFISLVAIMVISALVNLIILAPFGLILAILSSGGNAMFSWAMIIWSLGTIFATFFGFWVSTRLSMKLPARAIGRYYGYGEIWNLTRPQSKVFIAIAVVYVIESGLAAMLDFAIWQNLYFVFEASVGDGASNWICRILSGVIWSVTLLFGLSLLTETYRRYYLDQAEVTPSA